MSHPDEIDFSVHGNWVDGDILGTTKELIDICGVPVSPYAELPKPNTYTTTLTTSGATIAAARGGATMNGDINDNGHL